MIATTWFEFLSEDLGLTVEELSEKFAVAQVRADRYAEKFAPDGARQYVPESKAGALFQEVRDGHVISRPTCKSETAAAFFRQSFEAQQAEARSAAAAALGSSRSEAKAAAARANGRKGGRPRKTE